MENYKKYIFDLDYTLLIPDWSREDEYFKKNIAIEEQEEFFKQKQDIINRYESEYPKYDYKSLSNHFKNYGFHLSVDIIKSWVNFNGATIKDEIPDGVIDLLNYLRNQKKDIVIFTYWFKGMQIPRLERTGLVGYVDQLVTGEDAMKPSIEAFKIAIGNTNKEDCIMIGDSYEKDITGAINAGIDYYQIDDKHNIRDFLNIVKSNSPKTYIKSLIK